MMFRPLCLWQWFFMNCEDVWSCLMILDDLWIYDDAWWWMVYDGYDDIWWLHCIWWLMMTYIMTYDGVYDSCDARRCSKFIHDDSWCVMAYNDVERFVGPSNQRQSIINSIHWCTFYISSGSNRSWSTTSKKATSFNRTSNRFLGAWHGFRWYRGFFVIPSFRGHR